MTLLFGPGSTEGGTEVRPFAIDRRLASNREFAAFVAKQPRWAKGAVPRLFAEGAYLAHWSGGAHPRAYAGAPVVHVSWFAARAFCQAAGGRLPTTAEWEYVAGPPTWSDPELPRRILQWYARPFRPEDLLQAPLGRPHPLGVEQLHQYTWEWTEDFGSVFLTGDNRQDGDSLPALFCGSGSSAATSRDDYAAFMRYALRSSLLARFTLSNVGFRCAYALSASPEDAR